ncbi:MAG TPA: hypothetical protein VFH50_12040 [Acidimicrobiales bacterium]|nr:hypothetical protein [Acidimicrobiales bacterium]
MVTAALLLAAGAAGCSSSSPTGPTSGSTTTTAGSGSGGGAGSGGGSGTGAGSGTAAVRVDATAASWHLGAGVSRAVVCTQGTSLLVLGGLATGDTSTDAVWTVDPAAGTARRSGHLARAVHDAAGSCTSGGALVFGGGAASTVGTVQRWSPVGTRLLGQLPQPRSDLAAAALGGRVYVVGGFDGTEMTAPILATSDGTGFSVVGTLPVPVRYPAVAAAAGAIWVIGGQLGTGESSSTGGQTDAIQRFDPATGRTVVIGHLPEPLGHASALALGGRLFVAGGRVGTTASDRIWAVDTRSGQVRAAGTLPGPVSDAGAAVVGTTGWLVGGELSGPTAPLDTVVELRVAGGG